MTNWKPKNIITAIEEIKSKNNLDYMDSILYFCEKNNLEIEQVAKAVNKDQVLKGKLQKEAEDNNFLKKGSRLPI
jgi:hypothetical protein